MIDSIKSAFSKLTASPAQPQGWTPTLLPLEFRLQPVWEHRWSIRSRRRFPLERL